MNIWVQKPVTYDLNLCMVKNWNIFESCEFDKFLEKKPMQYFYKNKAPTHNLNERFVS